MEKLLVFRDREVHPIGAKFPSAVFLDHGESTKNKRPEIYIYMCLWKINPSKANIDAGCMVHVFDIFLAIVLFGPNFLSPPIGSPLSDPGSQSRLSPPPPRYGSCVHLVFLGRLDWAPFFPCRFASSLLRRMIGSGICPKGCVIFRDMRCFCRHPIVMARDHNISGRRERGCAFRDWSTAMPHRPLHVTIVGLRTSSDDI